MPTQLTIYRIGLGTIAVSMPVNLFAAVASPRLIVTDFGKSRLEEISFFVISLLVLAAVSRWIWNGFHRDFPQLPYMTYRGTLGALLLWGTMFTAVISLISSLRQAMLPMNDDARISVLRKTTPTTNAEIIDRRIRIRSLWGSLSFYAMTNNSQFPNDVNGLDLGMTHADSATGLPYFITPDLKTTSPRTILASEPDIHPQRLLLFNDGTIVIEDRGGGRLP